MKETKSSLSSNHWRQYFVSTSRRDTNVLRCLILFKLDFHLWLNLKMKGSSIGRLPVENSDRKFRRRIKNSFGKPTVPSRWMDIHHCAAANGNTKHRIHNIFVHLSLGEGVLLHNTSSIHCISAPKTRTYCSEFPGSFGTTGQMHKFCRFGRCCSGSIVIL